MSMKLLQGDCVERMNAIKEASVDLVVTSPPYDNLRNYNNLFDVREVAKGIKRVLKNGGVCVWVVNDQTRNGSESLTSFKQALTFQELGFKHHDTMIYAKNNPMPLTHNRYEQHFEYMFIFSKGKPKTFNPIMVENKLAGKERSKKSTYRQQNNELRKINTPGKFKDKSIKGNIWYYSVGGNRTNHPAVFPERLASDHIISWSNENEVVLDPFMGSGTTGVACKKLNRKFVGIELDEEYFKIAQSRIGSS